MSPMTDALADLASVIPVLTVSDVADAAPLARALEAGGLKVIEMTWRTVNNGFVVVEVPITFAEREIGVSKMSGSNIREALVKVAQWGIEGRRDRARSSRAHT